MPKRYSCWKLMDYCCLNPGNTVWSLDQKEHHQEAQMHNLRPNLRSTESAPAFSNFLLPYLTHRPSWSLMFWETTGSSKSTTFCVEGTAKNFGGCLKLKRERGKSTETTLKWVSALVLPGPCQAYKFRSNQVVILFLNK